ADLGGGRWTAETRRGADLLGEPALEQQRLAEARVLRRVEIDGREHVGRDRAGGEGLAVVGVVSAQRQHEAVDDLEIDLAEQGDGFALQRIVFVESLAGREELACVATAIRGTERTLERRQAERAARKLLDQ